MTTDRPAHIRLIVVRPPAEASSHLVLLERPWRSKYSTARCSGEAKRCQAGECEHAARVAASVARCRPRPWATT